MWLQQGALEPEAQEAGCLATRPRCCWPHVCLTCWAASREPSSFAHLTLPEPRAHGGSRVAWPGGEGGGQSPGCTA